MIACLSPNGQNLTRGNEPPTRLAGRDGRGHQRARARAVPARPGTIAAASSTGNHCSSIMIEPKRGGVFAGLHENGGLYYSADGGETWERRMNGITIDHVFSVALRASRREHRALRGNRAGVDLPQRRLRRDVGRADRASKKRPIATSGSFPGKPHIPHVKSITVEPRRSEHDLGAGVEQGDLLQHDRRRRDLDRTERLLQARRS